LDDVGEHVTTGRLIIMAATMKEMNSSQMSSLFVTIAFVILILTAVMYYTHRSFLLGAMATIPTLISVVMVWGTMAAIGMPLNVMTLTIASLAVGMGVTYGIHISNRYATELIRNGLGAGDAIRKTMRETGKGVFAAVVTTVAGFGVMVFSKILPMYQFGIITALAIAFGYVGSVFVLPSMLVIWGKRAGPKLAERYSGVKTVTAADAEPAPERTAYPERNAKTGRVPYHMKRKAARPVRRRPKI
jgi:predicted RND superfamily exporter protein